MIISTEILDSVDFYYYLKFKLNVFNREFQKHHQIITSYNHNIYDLIDELRKIKITNNSKQKIQAIAVKTFPELHRINTNISIEYYIVDMISSYKLLTCQ